MPLTVRSSAEVSQGFNQSFKANDFLKFVDESSVESSVKQILPSNSAVFSNITGYDMVKEKEIFQERPPSPKP